MIDWEKSAKLNNMGIEALKARFSRFPGSGKKVVAICDNPECNESRLVEYKSYRSLCVKCVQIGKKHTDESKEKVRLSMVGRYKGKKQQHVDVDLDR